jgi:hypothetical protein
MMKLATILASACVGIVAEPPILPFTEISDQKLMTMMQHMVVADEITTQDFNVALQLEHIRWKYTEMRTIFYDTAKQSADGSVIFTKDLGKIFDAIDTDLEKQREKALQEIKKRKNEQEQKKTPVGNEA